MMTWTSEIAKNALIRGTWGDDDLKNSCNCEMQWIIMDEGDLGNV